jgi:hypothetical protein
MKEFLCYWGSEFVTPDVKGGVTMADITIDSGYTKADIAQIDALDVDGLWQSPEFATHYIIRTK